MKNKNLSTFFNKILYHRAAYIPNFRSLHIIFKMTFGMIMMCAIYTLTKISDITTFGFIFIQNISSFSPYFLFQIAALFAMGKFLKKIPSFYAIFIILITTCVCVYCIDALVAGTFHVYIDNPQDALLRFTLIFTTIFLFLIYFDWNERVVNPANELARLSFLQSKMNPHFLFNTLNTIIALIGRDNNMAKKMIFSLCELLRASLKQNNIKALIPIEQEIFLSERYLDIEKIRMGERLQVEWNIHNVDKILLPQLTLQPLIENSVIHGIAELEEGGTIKINISQDDNWLNISISNPYRETALKYQNGNNITLKNLKERLNLIYNGNYDLHVTKTNLQYTIKFSVPVKRREPYEIE